MSAVATVEDGKIVNTNASSLSASNKTETKSNGTLDKDAFLQLLVAEMQNQDPLEPTTNTEYISQFAQFSSLEEMQNMGASVEMQRAQSLVGQEVFLDVTDSSGNTTQICGKVDYAVMEGTNVYVSVDDTLYAFEDVTTVLDSDYWEAYNLAYSWTSELAKIPTVNKLALSDKAPVEAVRKSYDEMTDYQKTFIASPSIKLLESYEAKIDELQTAADNAAKKDTDTDTDTDGKPAEETAGSES